MGAVRKGDEKTKCEGLKEVKRTFMTITPDSWSDKHQTMNQVVRRHHGNNVGQEQFDPHVARLVSD